MLIRDMLEEAWVIDSVFCGCSCIFSDWARGRRMLSIGNKHYTIWPNGVHSNRTILEHGLLSFSGSKAKVDCLLYCCS